MRLGIPDEKSIHNTSQQEVVVLFFGVVIARPRGNKQTANSAMPSWGIMLSLLFDLRIVCFHSWELSCFSFLDDDFYFLILDSQLTLISTFMRHVFDIDIFIIKYQIAFNFVPKLQWF